MGENLNWNLFNQIAQESNYDKKVRNREKEMEYAMRMEDRANKRAQEQMVADQQVNAQMDLLDQELKQLLPEDQAKVRGLEKQARQGIMKGVAAAQGDMKQFLLQGGYTQLRDYKKAVLDSDEVARGVQNMSTYKQIQTDLSEGKEFHDIQVTYKDKGKKVTQVVDVNTMLSLFKEGKIEKVNYNGAQKAVDYDPLDFAKNYHPTSPHEAKQVSVKDLADYFIAKGQSADIAMRRAEQSIDSYNPETGEPMTSHWWGVKDDDFSNIDRAWYGKGGKGTMAKHANLYAPTIETISSMEPTGDTYQADWETANTKEKSRKIVTAYNPGNDVVDALASHIGFKLNSDGSYSGNMVNQIGFFNPDTGHRSKIDAADYKLKGVGNEVKIVRDAKDKNKFQMFLPVQIRVSEEYMEDKLGEPWWGGTSQTWNSKVAKDVEDDDGEGRILQTFVNIPLDAPNREALNAKIGRKIGTVAGGVSYENYTSMNIARPEGTVPTNQEYSMVGGQIYGNNTVGNAATKANQAQAAYAERINYLIKKGYPRHEAEKAVSQFMQMNP